jgi:hypothetical protein
MPTHPIFVGFPGNDWGGPKLATWEVGIVEGDVLAMLALAEDSGEEEDGARWIGCGLDDVLSVVSCDVTPGSEMGCLQARVVLRDVGTLYAFISDSCLSHLQASGVDVAPMSEEDAEASRRLWAELGADGDGLPAEIQRIVNSPLTPTRTH